MQRSISTVLESRPTIEGAGVHLRRAFGHAEVPRLDPFLLLDDFRSENPLEYMAGFPWHPHRGIETVTYMLDGKVAHEDSLGHRGTIGAGDVQWMTSGSGIIHQEMPKLTELRKLGGFQLWVNLPAAQKMSAPRYQEVPARGIPTVELARGARARVIAGAVGGTVGPVRDLMVDPRYLDVEVEPRTELSLPVPDGHTALAYLVEGRGSFDPEARDVIDRENLVIFDRNGTELRVRTGEEHVRFLFVSGRPLGEPIAWWGPIVMNDRRQIETALTEFQEGTFVKHRAAEAPGAPAASGAAPRAG
jgi:redox-sensitive bicupin YhaK (pirin superfamily)